MSLYIAHETIDGAWLQALDALTAQGKGTATHLFVTIATPQAGTHAGVTNLVDATLQSHKRRTVATVANTLFPSTLYNPPEYPWSPDLPAEQEGALNAAANRLYDAYLGMLPDLRLYGGNSHGTYFSRMISWPGRIAGGANQLDRRITFLRKERRNGRSTSNTSDIAIAGEADGANDPDDTLLGGLLEQYAVSDTRTEGFPCLVHIDVSVRNGFLALLGVYRHWHLVTRGYGNLVGLARLQTFLCQQTGFEPGELAVAAGHANAEFTPYAKRDLTVLVREAQALLGTDSPVAAR